jgi:trans-aconitate 2-methyltransferase
MAASGSREWDAGTYDRVSGPQKDWSGAVIDRLELAGDEVVLDAGCGSGRVTEELLARLPRGRVIAADGSAAMVEAARERLGDRVELIHADLLRLELPEPVDVVFSNAVFHWIDDHPALFRRLAALLRPGGRLEAQCGGEGNVARFYAAAAQAAEADERFRSHLEGFSPTYFAGPRETEARLAEAGFTEILCGLEPRPVRPDEPGAFIETVCLGPHLDRLPEELRRPYLEAVLELIGPRPELDYVRLNISARKGAAPA